MNLKVKRVNLYVNPDPVLPLVSPRVFVGAPNTTGNPVIRRFLGGSVLTLMTRRALVLVTIFAGALSLSAQRYNFKFFGEEDGLNNLAVEAVLQDRAGFLWAGTQNGLYRYDGNRFTLFDKNRGLPGTRIESLYESSDATLWVSTDNGLARSITGGRFEGVPLQDRAGRKLADGVNGRQGFSSDRAGHLYFATEKGLVVGRPLLSKTKHAQPEKVEFHLLSGPSIASVYTDTDDRIWYGCGNSLCVLENGETAREISTETGLPKDRWDAIIGDLDGNLWVRSSAALYVRSGGSRLFQPVSGLPGSPNTFPTLALDPSGKVLAPTYRGLAKQTSSGWEIIDAERGLTSNDISAVFQDREGSILGGLTWLRSCPLDRL